ncbi:hypothetical protein K7W03_22580 [Sphingobium sp. PNB]|uniref:hypothetical protein n=1 Tax=Sphingobium sp. PNB TaxID=863934 RepID=UPI001CA4171B|nr:hypothetical protein [Sphingobium sp. PNB]MCB4862380.1 hypothetical protein [Sphingobium sp. PNB]
MSRYFTRPRSLERIQDDFWDNEAPLLPSVSVPDHEATDTGILDRHGDTIWRAPNPIGFGRNEEW